MRFLCLLRYTNYLVIVVQSTELQMQYRVLSYCNVIQYTAPENETSIYLKITHFSRHDAMRTLIVIHILRESRHILYSVAPMRDKLTCVSANFYKLSHSTGGGNGVAYTCDMGWQSPGAQTIAFDYGAQIASSSSHISLSASSCVYTPK